MAGITTQSFELPAQVAQGIIAKATEQSVLARIAKADPQIQHGQKEFITFTEAPRAQYLGEGDSSQGSTAKFGAKKSKTNRIEVNIRVSEEALYADREYKVGAFTEVSKQLSAAVARAIDLGAIHGISPYTGQTSALITDKLVDTTNSVTHAGKVEDDVNGALDKLLANSYVPNGVIIDPQYALAMRKETYKDGRRRFPELGLDMHSTSYVDGVPAAVSTSVSGKPEIKEDSKLLGVFGDFSMFKWGIVNSFPIETITYGNPDGAGDLKQMHQIVLRASAYVGWVVIDPNAFVKVVTA